MAWPSLSYKPESYGYVFCINPGRSGSNYLAELLDTASNARAFHEPEPQMTGRHLLSVTMCNYATSYKARGVKLDGIRKLCRQVPKGGCYVETSHMFIKTYFDVVTEQLPNVQVVHLQRKICATLKSFVEMNYFTDKNKAWPQWMISPAAATRALALPKPYEEMDQMEKCIAYLLDIEARASRFKRQYPDTPVLRVKLDELNNSGNVTQLFDALGLQITKKTLALCGTRINSRPQQKAKQANPTSIEDCRDRLLQYFELLDQEGITRPEGIYFDPSADA